MKHFIAMSKILDTHKKLILSIIPVLLFVHSGNGQVAGNIDTSFNPIDTGFYSGDGPSTFIRAAAVQADGRIVLSSNQTLRYNQVSVPRLIRVLPNGLLDSTFNSGGGPFGDVDAIAIQPDGKILIGGDFILYNSVLKGRIVRINTDGSLDNTFNPTGSGFNTNVFDIELQADGKIIVAGSFSNYNGFSAQRIIRLDTNGNIDQTFSVSGFTNGPVNDIELLPNGKIMVAGDFTQFNGVPCGRITRLFSNGSIDTTFDAGQGANFAVNAVCVDSIGNVYVGGGFDVFDGDSTAHIAKLDPSGNLDTTLSNSLKANAAVFDIKMDLNHNLVVAGNFTHIANSSRNYVARIDTAGGIDSNFISPLATIQFGTVQSICLQPDGKVLTIGYYTKPNQGRLYFLSRLIVDGSFDFSFNRPSGANNHVYSVAVQSDQKLVIGGKFSEYNGVSRNRIARLLTKGELDTSFNVGRGFDDEVLDIQIQTNGKILVSGRFTAYNGYSANRIIRLNQNGMPDTTFDVGLGASDPVHKIEIQQDGKILLGGSFSQFNGTTANSMLRLDTNGNIDGSFSSGFSFSQTVAAIKEQPNGKILVGGNFSFYNGGSSGRLLRLNMDGSLDTSLPANAVSFSILDIEERPNGKLIVAGASGYLREIDTNGTTLNPVWVSGTGPNNLIRDVLIQPDNKIVISGDFTQIGPSSRRGLARFNADGTPDYVFNAGEGINFVPPNTSYVKHALAMQYDSLLIYGGQYGSINNEGRNRISRLYACSPEFTIDSIEACNEYTWIDSVTYTSNTFGNTVNYKTKLGCDSTVILALTVDTLEISIFRSNDTLFADPGNLSDYEWINCDSSAVSYPAFNNLNYFVVPANGRYSLVAKKRACTDTSLCINIVDLGFNETTLSGFNIYPNPNQGVFTIDISEPIEDIKLFNTAGIEVNFSINGDEVKLAGLPVGLYLIIVKTENRTYISRVYLVE